MLTKEELKHLEGKAEAIRESIIDMLVSAGSGHTAGPLGMADIFAVLYFHMMTHDPKNPERSDRDRLILSNGHIVPVRYAAMAHAGYFPVAELKTLRKFGSRLQGHPERAALPGLENTSGPLGSGLSQAAGIAYAARMDGKDFRVYCVTSDGEHNEGNTWEGVMWAAKNKLHNLTVIMDRNNIQIDGNTEDIMPLNPVADKYRAFNWHVEECDGNDINEVVEAIEKANAAADKPAIVIARTVPGKGIPEIERDFHWHGKPPSAEEGKKFLHELRTLSGQIVGEHQ